jgi:thiol-disulfide isomerase/thioredoxin
MNIISEKWEIPMRKILLTLSVFFLAGMMVCGCGNSKSESAGKEFAAELTTLDGKTLSIPKDTLGKVVLVDFWASWCPPCLELVPHMKQLHEKYKDKDFIIVGISLDTDKNALKKFITDQNLSWIQTYSGKGWKDPTAQKYGIDGIPSVWVIGKDGKVISTNAVNNESKIIDKALKD